MAAEKVGLGMTRGAAEGKKYEEFGGWVISKDGKYTYTVPVTFGQDSHFYASNVTVPDGYTSVGWYHTHPDPGSWGEGFSPGDMNFSDRIGKTGYVGMSYSGNVRQYNLACVSADENDKAGVLKNLSLAFQHKDQVLPGEQMPDPGSDSSFKKYAQDSDFKELLNRLKLPS